MILLELFKKCDFESIFKHIGKYYPQYVTSRLGFQEAYKEIIRLEPEYAGLLLTFKKKADDDGNVYIKDYCYCIYEGTFWTLDNEWCKIVSAFINETPFQNGSITYEEAAACALFEMTFSGFSDKDRHAYLNNWNEGP